MLRDFSRLLDNSLRNACAQIRDKSLTYDALLQQIPAISYENQLQVLKLPDIAPTRPVKWALDFTRIRTLHNLIRYENELSTGSVIQADLQTSNAPRNLHTRAFIKRKLLNMRQASAVPIAIDFGTSQLLDDLDQWL